MVEFKTYYKRHLPHHQPLGYTYFITFRLAGSLPNSIIQKLIAERESNLKEIAAIKNLKEKSEKYHAYQTAYFERFDSFLDTYHYGQYWLGQESIATIVKEAFHFYDTKAYDLLCYCIMSNHVHLVITPIVDRISDSILSVGRISDPTKETTLVAESKNSPPVADSTYIVTKILQDLKRYTAGKCNKILNRTGNFWQYESYDHIVRDENDLIRIINYTLNNPVKIGLVTCWKNWKWSYYKYDN